MDTGDVPRIQSLFGDRLPQSDLIRTMKHFLACLTLCASLSASAQGDNCTVLGIQDLTQMVLDFQAANDSLQSQINSLQNQFNNLTFSVDGLPPCNDLDHDDVCDFADACPPVIVSFTFMWFGNELVGEYLVVGGTYPEASLSNLAAPEACLRDISLVGADLSGADLTGANLYGADLTGADLTGANLSGAEFGHANLTDANLTGANLTGARFGHAYVDDANLTGANLSGAELGHGYFFGADLTGANLSGAKLGHGYYSNAILLDANLSNADFNQASLPCVQGCPSALPAGYTCEPNPDCSEPDRYRIVPN